MTAAPLPTLSQRFEAAMLGGIGCLAAPRPSGARGYVLDAFRLANAMGCKRRKRCAFRVLNWLRAAPG